MGYNERQKNEKQKGDEEARIAFLHMNVVLTFPLRCGCILSFLSRRGDLHYSSCLSSLPLECSLQLSDPLCQHFASLCGHACTNTPGR